MVNPHRNNNFSYKTIAEPLKRALDERARLDNTQQLAMPFAKVTSTVDLPKILGQGSAGFTLGIQQLEEDFRIDDIYSDGSGNALIGYTYVVDQATGETRTKRIYANHLDPIKRQQIDAANAFFDGPTTLYSSEPNFDFIPPPGITSMTIDTHTNAYSRIATVGFSVPTLAQMEMLHRTFLIPGVGMVLEWGQQFAEKREDSYGEQGLTPDVVRNNLFPWYNRGELINVLSALRDQQIGLDHIYEKYTYPAQGQYSWMYGRLANFNIDSNSDGSFNCSLKVYGPNENSWAYNIRSTYVRPVISQTDPVCIQDSTSLEAYFNKTAAGAANFKNLLERVYNSSLDGIPVPELEDNWSGHVLRFTQEDKNEGQSEPAETADPNVSEDLFQDSQDSYFMTWRFFVNVVLNDDVFGAKSIFRKAGFSQEQLNRIATIRPYTPSESGDVTLPGIVDPYENFVGCNPNLRSTDPSTLIIVNKKAAELAEQELEIIRSELTEEERDLFTETNMARKFAAKGNFYTSTARVQEPVKNIPNEYDRGFLSTGVWINHKAVIQCMVSSNTLIEGISKLLTRMNSATENYWNLAIDDSEPPADNLDAAPGDRVRIDYGIVDINYKESSYYALENFLDNVHVFNKYIRDKGGSLVGSDVIDCRLNLSLPQALFTQIALGGLTHPRDAAKAGLTGTDPADEPGHPTTPGPNEIIREMFAINSLLGGAEEGNPRSIDLTQDTFEQARNRELESTCGGKNVQLPGETAGSGHDIGSANEEGSARTDAVNRSDAIREQIEIAEASYRECLEENCDGNRFEEITRSGSLPPDAARQPNLNELSPDAEAYITSTPWSAAFISKIAQDAGLVFPGSLSHAEYSQNIRDGLTSTYRGWQVLDPRFVTPSRGDIIVANRNNEQKSFSDPFWRGASHGDVVVSVQESNVRAIGGNLSERVRSVIRTTSNGVLNTTIGGDFYVILRPPTGIQREALAGAAEVELARWTTWTETSPAAFDTLDGYYRSAGGQIPGGAPVSQNTRGSGETVLCRACEGRRRTLDRLRTQLSAQVGEDIIAQEVDANIESFTKQFSYLRTVFRYIEPFPAWMVRRITTNADGKKANAFGAAPGSLAIKGEIVLPGIAGLRVGELFWIDRIPSFYRAYGAFTTMSLSDEISSDGWVTKINAVYYYLGEEWKRAAAALLQEELGSNE